MHPSKNGTYNNDETVALLEQIKKTIPDDDVPPSQHSISLLKKTTENSEKSPTAVRKNVAKKHTGSRQKAIKPEPISKSDETIIRNSDGKSELMARIREDFGEESTNFREESTNFREESTNFSEESTNCETSMNCCVFERYLCEKSGTFCSRYRTGTPDKLETLSNFEFSDCNTESESSVTEDIDWGDLIDLTQQDVDIKPEIQEIDLTIKIDKTENIENIEVEIVEPEDPLIKTENVNLTQESVETVIYEPKYSSDSESEEKREAALKALNSDVTSISSSSSESSSSSSSEENPRTPQAWEPGHVKNLDILNELVMLQENYEQSNFKKFGSGNSDCEKSYSTGDFESQGSNDPKLSLRPVVLLENIDFDKCYGLSKNGKKYRISSSENEEEEIRRLTDLTTFKRRNIIESSSESDTSKSPVRPKKKRLIKTRKNIISSSSSTSDSDASISSVKSVRLSQTPPILNTPKIHAEYVPGIPDDILDTQSELSDFSTDDSAKAKKPKPSTKKEIVELSDDENDKQSQWRQDKLLTGNLTIGNLKENSGDETNDSTANEILERDFEKYVENEGKEKPKRKRNTSVQSIDSSDSDAVVSINGDSDDSDIQFVDLKRKLDSDDEGTSKKKGRRNIREVLKDSELHEETQKADKEESERKERLSLKQKTLDTFLTKSQLSQEEVGLVLDMNEHKTQPLIIVHPTLVPRLKAHQKRGIKFMWDVCFESVSELKKNKGVGCILAHCMGLGKTMQVVVLAHTIITHKELNMRHVLVVCPLSTVFNWRSEFEETLKVCPKSIRLFDIRPDRQKTFTQRVFEVKRWREIGGVLMMGYESFQTLVSEQKLNNINEKYKQILIESLIDPGPDVVVCDEGHMLKNGKTLRFISLSRVKTSRRIILTGTPLQNNLLEYYHMVNFVKPHLLGTLDEYKNRFVNPIMNGQYEDSNKEDIHLMKKRSHILHKKLETTVQRFEESELAPYLPERHDYVLFFQLTPLQILLYEHYLTLLTSTTRTLFKNYHALQNIWTHPALLKIKFDKRKNPTKLKHYDEDFIAGLDPDLDDISTNWFQDILPEDVLTNISYGTKIEVLFSVIKLCEAVKEKLLVFSSSIDELDLIEQFLNRRTSWKKNEDYFRMDGAVPPDKRSRYCNEFNNDKEFKSRVFLVSHKVGGLGLNLTAASRVVLMDVNWNPAYDMQSVFRVYRFGQTKNCYIYRFVSLGTMEEVVYSRAVTKLAISCRVVDEHQIKRHFNEDDLQRMYSLIKDYGDPQTPTLPQDRLLAKLWETHKPKLFKFCDHQSLLENLAHEELNEEEMNLAWEEFRNEVDREKQSKDMAAQIRLQHINSTIIGPSPLPICANPRFPLDVRTNLPQNYRFKRPNPLPVVGTIPRTIPGTIPRTIPVATPVANSVATPVANRVATPVMHPVTKPGAIPVPVATPAVPIPSTTNYQQQANFLSRLGYSFDLSTVATPPKTDTSTNPTPSTSSFVTNSFINASYPTSTYPLSNGNSRKGKTLMRNNGNNAKNVPIREKENVFQRTVANLNSNGVSVLPESRTADVNIDLTN